MPLQGEGAVQGLLATTPNMIEGDLLKTERSQGQPALLSLREWRRRQVMGPASGLGSVFSGGQSGLSTQMDRGKSGQGPFRGGEGTSLNV